MPLTIHTLVLGPLENNTYLAADEQTREAVVIDPSFGSEAVAAEVRRRNYRLKGIWLTHAHFDHLAGVQQLQAEFNQELTIGLHPSDIPLWNRAGDAALFGFILKPGPEPHIRFNHGQLLTLGQATFEVRHTPGHSPGHVIFSCEEAGAVLCGDLIFQMGVGRTDLPGGDYATLLESINTQVLSLPLETRLLSGHGPETTIAAELANNPYINSG
jgi:hydroxyacylglutathione hydrolase